MSNFLEKTEVFAMKKKFEILKGKLPKKIMISSSIIKILHENINHNFIDKAIDNYNSMYDEVLNNDDYSIVSYNKNDHFKYYKNASVIGGGYIGGGFVADKKITSFYEDNPLDTYMIFNKINQEYIGNFSIKTKDDKVMLAIALSIDKYSLHTSWAVICQNVSKHIRVIRDFLLSKYPYDKKAYHISLVSAGPDGDEMEFLIALNKSNIMHAFSKGSMYDWDYCFN